MNSRKRFKKPIKPRFFSCIILYLAILLINAEAQQKKIAIILVSDSFASLSETASFKEKVFSKISDAFSAKLQVIDSSLANSAFQAQGFQSPLNLSTTEAKNLGNAIGCNFYLLIKAEILARTSIEKGTFYEAYSALFFVNTITGRLFFWKLLKAEAETPKLAEEKFFYVLDEFLSQSVTEIQLALDIDLKVQNTNRLPEMLSENLPGNFRPPVPYRQVKPEYPMIASLYLVTATIDVAVDIDEEGKIAQTEILRWAGYGLEESVINAIKSTNWRPAEKQGKPIAVRVLLRYNFKKTRKEK